MNIFNKIYVLNEFKPLLRVLKSYNRDNFRHRGWYYTLKSVLYALCTSVLILCTPLNIIMSFWYLTEVEYEVEHLVAALASAISYVYLEVAFTALVYKNEQIGETIWRLQTLIDRREFHWIHTFFVSLSYYFGVEWLFFYWFP